MDKEIQLISEFHPIIAKDLRRNSKNGCLDYIGPNRGALEGNPSITVQINGKQVHTHLRRWIWNELHRKPLPKKRYVVMSCGNHNCMALQHMTLQPHHRYYRKRSFFITHPDYPIEKIYLIKHFQGYIFLARLSQLLKIPVTQIRKIKNGIIFQEIRVPKDYQPPELIVRFAEKHHINRRRHTYLGPKNKAAAKNEIRDFPLPPSTRKFLDSYVDGCNYRQIAQQNGMDTSTVNERIVRALLRMQEQLGTREWIKIMLRDKCRELDYKYFSKK